MKSKLYSLSIVALLLFSIGVSAQCTVTFTVTPTGLSVSASATGTGTATIPTYGYDWGDSNLGFGQTATHTYASPGTYTICAYYFDLADTASCNAQSCQTITVVGIENHSNTVLNLQASPNPFSSELNINLTLDQPQAVQMLVYDITGKQVAVLQNGMMVSGSTTVNWKPAGLSAGIYFLQVKSGDSITTKKVVFTAQ